MFDGLLIEELVATVAKAEADLATRWRMKEELENVPAFMLARFPYVNACESVLLGVA